jgi:hypothetical protein
MSRNLLLFLGLVAVGGGAFYLYKSGKLVSMPGQMSQGAPRQMFYVSPKHVVATMQGYGW